MIEDPFIASVQSDDFAVEVLQRSDSIPVLVDFWADWCNPCKMLMPILDKLALEYEGKLWVAKIDTESEKELSTTYGIRSLPTAKIFRHGQVVDEFMGVLPEPQIKEIIDRHVVHPADAEIDKAKRRYALTEKIFREAGLPDVREFSENFKGVEFIADDAINLAGYGQIPSQFNVIFIRHQNLWHDRSTWQRIYDFALSRLTDDGILVITSYFDREHFLALELIKMLGGNVLVSERNHLSRELSYPGKSIDRHVAAISKEK